MEPVILITKTLAWIDVLIGASIILGILFLQQIIPYVRNLLFYLFGNWDKDFSCYHIWRTFSENPQSRRDYKSWKQFKRLAYKRLLKEARTELHKINN